MNQSFRKPLLARILFSLFLAIVACGMSFYVILFVSLTVMALTHHANPATTPTLLASLRFVVLPLSVLLGIGVFFMSMAGWGKRRESAVEESEHKKTAA